MNTKDLTITMPLDQFNVMKAKALTGEVLARELQQIEIEVVQGLSIKSYDQGVQDVVERLRKKQADAFNTDTILRT